MCFREKPSRRRPCLPNPGDVALTDVHDALDIVDEMVDLALDDRLEVGLELAAGNLDVDPSGVAPPSLISFTSGPTIVTLPSSISFISAI